MKKTKNTKRALLGSFITMLLCLSMFVGTTFAWFTDSVTSGVNTIVSGNLDIEVNYSKNGSNWNNLEGADTLFSSDLWEPGHTEVVYLKVQNVGSLGLKYKVLVTPVSENGGVNVAGESFKLSDYLVFGTTEPAENLTTYTRETARAAVAANGRGLNDVNSLTQSGTMVVGNGYQYLALVVYMPEEVGNAANYKTGTAAPTIELGIKVVATQMASENDSFGPNYDNGAVEDPFYTVGAYYDYFPQVVASKAVIVDNENKVSAGTVIEAQGKLNSSDTTETTLAKVTVPSGASLVEGTTELTVTIVPKEPKDGTTSDTQLVTEIENPDRETANFDIKVEGIDASNTEDITVEVFVGKGLANVKVYHNGTLINGTQYNASTGIVTFTTTRFSDYTVAYDTVSAAIGTTIYGSVAAAIEAANAKDTIALLRDIKVTETIATKKNLTINMNGYNITGDGVRALHVKQGTLTLDGIGTVSSTVANVGSSVIRVGDNAATSAAKLYVNKGVTVSTATAYGITAFGAKNEYVYVYGTVTSAAPENASYDGCAISTVGTDATKTYIYIYDGATVSAANTNAIYMPSGNLTVKSGATITGRTGIYVKSGTTTIEGGTITGNGPAVAYNYYGNGGISTGDAVVVDSCGYPNGKPSVWIHGGTFTSTNAKAVASYNTEGNERRTEFVDGGTFSSDPSDYLYYGYIAEKNGNVWTLKKTGTESDPLHITSIADWVAFAARPGSDHSGKYYVVDCDLDFSNTTDVVCLSYFPGSIDFQGHELKGFTATNIGSCSAVFDEVGARATIKNVKFSTINYRDSEGAMAALHLAFMLPYYQTGVNLLFENVSVYGDVTLAGNNTGLILNWACGTKGNITFKNCKNYVNMINSGYTAPFMGLSYGWGYVNNTITFDGCENYGTIISTDNEACMLISNPTKHSGDQMTLVVNNCKNYGKIIAGAGKAANLALNVGSTGEAFYTADQIKAFETDGKIVNAGEGACTNVSSVQLNTTNENTFDFATAIAGLENVHHYVLSFQFQGTGGAANGGVTSYDFTFNSTGDLLAQDIYAYEWKNAVEGDEVLIAPENITEHTLGGSKYYTAVVDDETVYVYNKAGYWMRRGGAPVVNLVAYDADGRILLVGYYRYAN